MNRGKTWLLTAFTVIPLLFMLFHLSSKADENICGLQVGAYISGDFHPPSNQCFVSVKEAGIPVNNRDHYLRAETVEALKLLYAAFGAEHPAIPFYITSSTRNYSDQRSIWQRKWKAYSRDEKDGTAVAKKILRYSSMPGTSRHHWGTDFDINELNNRYYERGDGRVLYEWMQKNAPAFGFCMPYTPGRTTGYAEEKWHWSYRQSASRYLELWNREYDNDSSFFFSGRDFTGRSYGAGFAHEYVNAINGECR